MQATALLFAAGFEVVVTIVILVISFLGWLVNLANERNKPAPRPRGPRPQRGARDRRIQNEIDVFLQEVGGKRKPPEEVPEVPIEVVPEEELRRRERQQRRRRPVSTGAGRDLRQPASTRLGERIGEVVEADLPHLATNIGQPGAPGGPAGGLSVFAAPPAPLAPQVVSENVARVKELLRDPQGVRQAVLVSEILGPPGGRHAGRSSNLET